MNNDALRVLMIAPTPYFSDRGCHVRIYEEARSLMRRGHEVCIVTYHLGRDMPGIRVERTPPVPWYHKQEAGPSWHKPYLDILLLWKCIREIRSFQPHIIHAHLHEGALVGIVLKYLYHLPLLFDYQGSLTGESLNHGFIKKKSIIARVFRLLEKAIDRGADHIVTSSTAGRQELIQEWGISSEKVSDLIDGVDTEIFAPAPRKIARQELGIDLDKKLVVYLGLFNKYQGVDLLLEVIARIKNKSRNNNIHFLLMGYPDIEYRALAETMGLLDLITFTGRVDYGKAATYLSAGDIAVSPKLARTEANGKLFNYMACSLPSIVFDSPINREILGDTGIYVEHGNAVAMADAIMSTLQLSEKELALHAEQTRERAQRYHSWEARTSKLETVYGAMLN